MATPSLHLITERPRVVARARVATSAASHSRRDPGAGRVGRTVEQLTIAVLVAVGSLLMTGALLPARGWSSRQGAVDEVGRFIYRARAVALRSARTASLVRSGSVLTVYVDSAGKSIPVRSVDLHAGYAVNLWATKDTLTFDPRGFVRSTAPVFVITGKQTADTICVPTSHDPYGTACR